MEYKNEIGMSSFLSLLGKHLNGEMVDCKSLVEALQEKEALESGPLADSVIEEKKPKTRPLTFDELIPLVGTPVRITFDDCVTYQPLILGLDTDDNSKEYLTGQKFHDFSTFYNHVTRLDGSKFETEDK